MHAKLQQAGPADGGRVGAAGQTTPASSGAGGVARRLCRGHGKHGADLVHAPSKKARTPAGRGARRPPARRGNNRAPLEKRGHPKKVKGRGSPRSTALRAPPAREGRGKASRSSERCRKRRVWWVRSTWLEGTAHVGVDAQHRQEIGTRSASTTSHSPVPHAAFGCESSSSSPRRSGSRDPARSRAAHGRFNRPFVVRLLPCAPAHGGGGNITALERR